MQVEGRLRLPGESNEYQVLVEIDSDGAVSVRSGDNVVGEWPPGATSASVEGGVIAVTSGSDEWLFIPTDLTALGEVSAALNGRDGEDFHARIRSVPVAESTEGSGGLTVAEAVGRMPLPNANPASLSSWIRLAALAFFFLPWMSVSCLGETVGSISGANSAFGVAPAWLEEVAEAIIDFAETLGGDTNAPIANDEPTAVFRWDLLGVFVLTAAAAAFRPFVPNSIRLALGLVAVGLMAWFSWDLAQSFADTGSTAGASIRLRFGFWGTWAFLLGATALDIVAIRGPAAIEIDWQKAVAVAGVVTILGGVGAAAWRSGWISLPKSDRELCEEFAADWNTEVERFSSAWEDYRFEAGFSTIGNPSDARVLQVHVDEMKAAADAAEALQVPEVGSLVERTNASMRTLRDRQLGAQQITHGVHIGSAWSVEQGANRLGPGGFDIFAVPRVSCAGLAG